MAGYFGAGLAGALQGQNEALANQPAQVARILAMKGEMQRQAILNQQLQDQQNSNAAMMQYYGNPPQTTLVPPAPGQASVPMTTPQTVPTSSFPGIAAGQLNAGKPMPMPQLPAASATPMGIGPNNIAPYRSMGDIVQELRQRNPGISPEATMAAASRIAANEKNSTSVQLQYANQALRIATLNNQLLNTQSLIDSRKQAAEDRKLSEADRQQARQDMLGLRQQENELRSQIAGMQHEDRQASLQTRIESAQQKQDAARQKAEAPVTNLINQIDSAIRMIDTDPTVVGGRGMIARAGEFLGNLTNPYAQTPASDFQQQILGIQSGWRKLPTVAANRFKADYNKIDSAVKGVGVFTNAAQARNSLIQLRDTLTQSIGGSGQQQTSVSSQLPAGIPPGSKLIGKSPDGADVYQAPDGKKYVP